jgi:hypothetical protein
MNQYHLEKCVKIMMEDWDGETSRPFYHYAFAIRKNRILAIGKNNPIMTSAKAYRLAKRFNIEHWQKYPFLHAEADLLLKLDEKHHSKRTTILSLKINRHGRFRLAKPCYKCEIALSRSNLTNVMWSLTDEKNLYMPILDSTLINK